MRLILSLLVSFFYLIILGRPAVAENIQCSTVTKPDLQNAKIGTLNVVNGKACTSDGLPDKCNWEHSIQRDEILRPTLGKEIRLIVINAKHMTGSGSWDTVLVFDCFNGNLRKIFEKGYLYGVEIKKNTDSEIIFISGEWQTDDPMCCPLGEKKEKYIAGTQIKILIFLGALLHFQRTEKKG